MNKNLGATGFSAILTNLLQRRSQKTASISTSLAQPMLRLSLAIPFFRSGLTRWDTGFSISDTTYYMFSTEFRLHIFGEKYPIPLSQYIAQVVSFLEIVCPVMLILGLFTRFSAFTLLMMTMVIQLVVPDGWSTFHLPWACMSLSLIALGPGKFSLDEWLRRF